MAANQLIPPGFVVEEQPASQLPAGFVIEDVPSTANAVTPPQSPIKRRQKNGSFWKAVGAYAVEPIDNLAARAEAVFPLSEYVNIPGIMPTTQDAIAGNQLARDNNANLPGQIAGNVVGLLPTAFASKNPLVQGALGGAAMSKADNLEDFLADASWGAAGSYATDKAMRLLGGAISPKVDAGVARLKEMGVNMTPGEIVGGRLKVLEDKAMSLPIVGDFISNARTRGIESFNRATLKNVLKDIDVDLPEDVPVGYNAIQYAQDALSNAYTSLMPQLRAKIDKTFGTRMNYIRQRAKLPAEQLQQFDDILQRELRGAFDPQSGLISGRNLKEAEERLRDLSKSYLTNDNPYVRRLGAAIGDTREQLISMLARQNPKAAAALRKANASYAKLARVEIAARNAENGIFSPGQFASAVRMADNSVRKRSTAGGRAYMQELANDGRAVLSNRTPNSFTADRLLMSGGVGALGLAPSAFLGPAGAIPLATYSSAALPYTGVGQKIVQGLLTGRQGAVSKQLAKTTRRAGKLITPYAGPILLQRPE